MTREEKINALIDEMIKLGLIIIENEQSGDNQVDE